MGEDESSNLEIWLVIFTILSWVRVIFIVNRIYNKSKKVASLWGINTDFVKWATKPNLAKSWIVSITVAQHFSNEVAIKRRSWMKITIICPLVLKTHKTGFISLKNSSFLSKTHTTTRTQSYVIQVSYLDNFFNLHSHPSLKKFDQVQVILV